MTTPTTTPTTPTRRGRPPGTGLYTDAARFLVDLAAACETVHQEGRWHRRCPTAAEVAWHLGISADTLARRLADNGWPCWAAWLAHWQPPVNTSG